MKIEKVIKFQVDGKLFETEEKATDYVEGILSNLVRCFIQEENNRGKISVDMRLNIPLTNFLLENREKIVDILSTELEKEEDFE